MARVVLLSLIAGAAARQCDNGLADLHVFLYNGTIRDKDPYFFDGDSDSACRMTVESDRVEVRLSDILLNANDPNYQMFFEFGCHPVDSKFTMTCYDWDAPLPLYRNSQIVFSIDPFSAWPPSGVKQTLVDKNDPQFQFVYKFVYGSNLEPDGTEPDATAEPVPPDAAADDDDPEESFAPPPRAPETVTKKKKTSNGREVTDAVAVAVACALVILAFCCGAFLWSRRSTKAAPPVAEVQGMELADVTVIKAQEVQQHPNSPEVPTSNAVEGGHVVDPENPATMGARAV
mmetsp:Transcript_6705/g.21111  ORF Transcript_6705/g.21111 Transcript_6705/m.21111 type:complete len:288 (+) Transcript_6705:58-921(+)